MKIERLKFEARIVFRTDDSVTVDFVPVDKRLSVIQKIVPTPDAIEPNARQMAQHISSWAPYEAWHNQLMSVDPTYKQEIDRIADEEKRLRTIITV